MTPSGSFISPLTPPISYMAYGIGGFIAVGVLYLVFLWRRNRRSVIDVGLVHLEEAPDQQAPPSELDAPGNAT